MKHLAFLTTGFLLTGFAVLASPMAARAQLTFITVNRTVAGGNPLNGVYNGSRVLIGASGLQAGTNAPIRVPGIEADAVDPASFGYSDQTGGGIEAYSNSVVRVSGGTFLVTGGTGAPGGGVSANDTSRVSVTGGTILAARVNGAAAGSGGATMTVSGGLIQGGQTIVAYISNGTLNVNAGATIRSTGGQPAIAGIDGSVINIGGGTVSSATGAGVTIGGNSALSVMGGTISGSAGNPSAVVVDNATVAATLTGGSIAGVRAQRNIGTANPTQIRLGGDVAVSNGVFSTGDAGIDVTGGTFTNYGGVAGAAFVTLGDGNINFYGTSLALSSAIPGSLSYASNTYTGNYYTFASGFFQNGQSAVGLRLFDATGAGASGGFTINASAVAPEPSSLVLLLLPAIAALIVRRRKNH